MVTLVVADDHPATLAGLARMPERLGVRVVASCGDGRAALDAILEHRPDVALLDLRMPVLSGRAVLDEVVRRELRTRIVVCSAHAEPPIVRAVIESGARGYLTKSAPIAELCAAARRVAAGGIWISADVQARLNEHLARGRRAPSERELEVLRWVAEGLIDREIAARMFISPETVRTNLKRLSDKLGVSGRAALVATAVRGGLIE